jgi:hypothetical protein
MKFFLDLNRHFVTAGMALIKILPGGAAPPGDQGSHRFAVNPATGALEVSTAQRDKAVKAIQREVRRMKLCMYLMKARLYTELFCLKARHLVSRLCSEIGGLSH